MLNINLTNYLISICSIVYSIVDTVVYNPKVFTPLFYTEYTKTYARVVYYIEDNIINSTGFS